MQKFSKVIITTFISSSLTVSAFAGNLSCKVLPDLFKAYLMSHYSVRTMTDDLKKHTVEQYLKTVDGSKTLLLDEDVTKIKKSLGKIFDSMASGDCSQLSEAEDIAVKRAGENEEFVKKFVNDPKYAIDEKTEFTFDPEKRSYAKSKQEKEDILKKSIHFQMSNYLMADTKMPEAKTLLTHRYELIVKRLKERDLNKLLDIFADSFAEAMDPHSTFFSKDKLEDFQIEMRLSLDGIGASLSSQDGYTVVEEIIPGGAADRAKVLMPKDKIIAVGQDEAAPVPVIDMDLPEVVKLIRGKKGTKVKLTLLRQEGQTTARKEVPIVRDKIDLKEQAAKIVYEKRKVGGKNLKFGIIDLPSFYGDTETGKRSGYDDMKALLKKAKDEKIDGLVLNLTRNGGGLLDDAVRISGLFIKKGPIVATQNFRKMVDKLEDKDEATQYSGPLIVLTSRVSASASEIFAGAMKDYNRALIVGADHTFGKGTVQSVIPLPHDLGAMKVTMGMFFIPSGNSTQHQGVAGDIVLPSPLNNDELGEKALDYSLPPNKIEPFAGADANSTNEREHYSPIEPALVEYLSKKSAERVAKDAKFQEIKKDIEEAAKNKGIIKLADVKQKSEAEKKKNKGEEKKTVAQKIKDADAPIINEALNIMGDWVTMPKNVMASHAPTPTKAPDSAKDTDTEIKQ